MNTMIKITLKNLPMKDVRFYHQALLQYASLMMRRHELLTKIGSKVPVADLLVKAKEARRIAKNLRDRVHRAI